jgi:hypothetical protein
VIHTHTEPESQIETDRIEAKDHRLLAEDLQDQADLERERYEAGYNAGIHDAARLIRQDGHKALSEVVRRLRK